MTRRRTCCVLEHLRHDLRRRASLRVETRTELTDVLLQALRFPAQRFARFGRQVIFVNRRAFERRAPDDVAGAADFRRREQVRMLAAEAIPNDARELAVCADDVPPVDREWMGSLARGLLESLHDAPCPGESAHGTRNLDD